MPKTKPVAKKEKTSTPKKPISRNKPTAKGIKLGGVPNQGNMQVNAE